MAKLTEEIVTIKNYNLKMTQEEAYGLRRLLDSGVSGPLLNTLNLRKMLGELNTALGFSTRSEVEFSSIARADF